MKCWGTSWKRTGGFDDGGGSGWGYGRGPSGYSEGIDRRGIGSDNAQDDDRNGKLGGNAGEWSEGGLVNYLWSTRTLLVGGRVLRPTPRGRKRLRYWRTRCEWIRR